MTTWLAGSLGSFVLLWFVPTNTAPATESNTRPSNCSTGTKPARVACGAGPTLGQLLHGHDFTDIIGQGVFLVAEFFQISEGRLRSAHCVRKDLEQEFWAYCHTDEHSDRVGELAFGTNLALRDMIGVLLQDEKVPGVHLAFGDPYGSQTGAPWKSRTHIDVLTRACDVWIDDEQVIRSGRYILSRFGL